MNPAWPFPSQEKRGNSLCLAEAPLWKPPLLGHPLFPLTRVEERTQGQGRALAVWSELERREGRESQTDRWTQTEDAWIKMNSDVERPQER